MRILVTGGAGYIGGHAARLFASRGHEVWVYDNLAQGYRQATSEESLIVGDLADYLLLEESLRHYRIEAVVHFAALTYVGESVREPEAYYRNNIGGTLSLLDAMRRAEVKRIVFSSTAAVYGQPQSVPIVEESPLLPVNPYGRSKLVVEWMLSDHAVAHGIGYAALRYFNAAGADPSGQWGEDHDPETHLIPLILQTALGLRPAIEVFGTDYATPDGTCVRDYVHVEDLAEAHLLALERIEPGRGREFNLGSGKGYSVKEVIQACEAVTGRPIPVRYGPRREGDPAVLVASHDRAARELGWQLRFPELHQMVETAWNWHRNHPHGYRSSATELTTAQQGKS